ncbi:MAG: putative MFS-type transporter YcaD [Alphaproteobacteria bacterium MarineAlpha5_Bin11]|nr:MAG: putative MFS-type transporter YcaD [Alphaproteobacteria bacterium MarineAlpha5_Bin11]PPR51463.1 MAG: putative MFS-type transporter YcaD [Alphaproteobacteria bacterium MarineAlpha5_Bin10]
MNKILNYLDFKSIDVSVKYLSISAFFTGIGLGYFFTLIVILLKHNHYSESTIGIIAAFFSFGLMSAGFVVSKILDKFGLYQTMLYSLSIQTLMMIMIFIFFHPIVMAIGHLVMGILGGIMWMTMDAWVNIVSNNNNRGKAIAFYNLSITLGFAIGPLLISFFGTIGLFPIILGIVLMIIRTPVIIYIKDYVNSVKIPKKEKNINFSLLKVAPFIFLAIFVSGIDDSSFAVLFPAYMINFLFTDRFIGFLLFFSLILGIFSQPFVGALTDKMNKRKLIFILLILHCIWPILLHNYYETMFFLLLSVTIWGIASTSLYTVALAYLGERYQAKELILATSVFIIVYESGEFFGPALIGYMMDIFGNSGFVYSIFISTIIVFIIGLIRTYYIKIKN